MATPIPSGPCEPAEVDLTCCPGAEDATPEQLLRARRIATEWLWRAGGMRHFASCPFTVYPCVRPCQGDSLSLYASVYGAPWVPYIGSDGQWRNAPCGCGLDPCEGSPGTRVLLDGPVWDVVAVDVDGVPLADTAWRVDFQGGWFLVRTDGEAWPMGTGLAVTYRTGLPLGPMGEHALSALTCHLLKSCSPGSCTCRLPANVRSVTRQGVSQEMIDPTELRLAGYTGIPEADAWIRMVNPYGQSSPSRVWSPDLRRPRITPVP